MGLLKKVKSWLKIKPHDWIITDIFQECVSMDVGNFCNVLGDWKLVIIRYYVQYSPSRNKVRLKYDFPQYATKLNTYYRALACLELYKMTMSSLKNDYEQNKLKTKIW